MENVVYFVKHTNKLVSGGFCCFSILVFSIFMYNKCVYLT